MYGLEVVLMMQTGKAYVKKIMERYKTKAVK